MKKRKKKILIIATALLLVLACVTVMIERSIYHSKYDLETVNYKVLSNGISARILLLTDLHNSEFGENNSELVTSVEEVSPDMIAIAGDLINYDEEDLSIAVELISKLIEIAPVYISFGNHELSYVFDADIIATFEAAGAVVLDQEYLDIVLDNQSVRIGGFYGYGFPVGYEVERPKESEWLAEFQDTNAYKILLSHMPLAWCYTDSLDYWDIDLVLSGHIHGGQVVIPLIGGLYVPDKGFFPGKLEEQVFSEDGEKCLVVSRGLGTGDELLPRINNIPEVIVVELE